MRGLSDPSRSHALIKRRSITLDWTLPGKELMRFSSRVEVMPNAALATRQNRVERSPRMLKCVSRLYPSLLMRKSTPSATIIGVRVKRLPDPLPGIAGAYAYRFISSDMVGRYSSEEFVDYAPDTKRKVSVYIDVFGFTIGPAEINLFGVGTPHPAARTVEDRLLVLLYSRAKRHRL
jgi:hypothetical protein